jgi:fucose 4-O-acetylase-like acetyltransferase
MGTIGAIQLAKRLKHGKVVAVLDYIGNKTLYILTFHFLAFKAVSYLWIKTHDLPINFLSQFPVLQATGSWMWVVYAIAGVALPLLVWELFHLSIGNNQRKLNQTITQNGQRI